MGGAQEMIQPKSHVVLRDSQGAYKVFNLCDKEVKLKMGKYPPIPVDAVFNVPYGAALRVNEAGVWARARRGALETSDETEVTEVAEDNRHIAMDSNAQKLSTHDISELREKCSGEEVVAAIASASTTFASRTKFSQEKFIARKRQKHVREVVALPPTAFELCEAYMQSGKQVICGLRFDYLSSLLCQANVQSGGRYLVLDCAAGLVTGAISQRLAGSGRVFRFWGKGYGSDKVFDEMDLGEAGKKVVTRLPLDLVTCADPLEHEWLRASGNAAPETRAVGVSREDRMQFRHAAVRDLLSGVEGVIVVAGEDEGHVSAEVLSSCMKYLAPGGRVVVYGPQLQPLATRQGEMRRSGDFVLVHMTQLFTREYQVLPQRTHPVMKQESRLIEGFLLAATKVQAAPGKGVLQNA